MDTILRIICGITATLMIAGSCKPVEASEYSMVLHFGEIVHEVNQQLEGYELDEDEVCELILDGRLNQDGECFTKENSND